MARKATKKTINFEKSLNQLETLVDKLEKGDISLEDSLKTFEQGVKLTRECQQALQ
ncbi:MAG: exodeoxyribonuclease VII small subunit, partial [Pseudomonadota bacterium]